jgi:hypothetical protein
MESFLRLESIKTTPNSVSIGKCFFVALIADIKSSEVSKPRTPIIIILIIPKGKTKVSLRNQLDVEPDCKEKDFSALVLHSVLTLWMVFLSPFVVEIAAYDLIELCLNDHKSVVEVVAMLMERLGAKVVLRGSEDELE